MEVIVLATDAFGGHGGIALYMRDLINCLADSPSKPKVTLISRAGDRCKERIPKLVTWKTEALRGPWPFLKACFKAAAQPKPVNLVVCGHINLMPAAWLIAVVSGAHIVLCTYGIEAWNPPARWSARIAASRANLIFSISRTTRSRLLSWCRVGREQVTLLPNAIKLDQFSPGPRSSELLDRYEIREKRVLMTLGRLSSSQRHKGVDEIIEVMPRLLEEFPDLVYLVAGAGDDIPRLLLKASRLGVGDQVVFAGMLKEAEKADHYRLANAFALTGHGDGFGFVLLEAMACGVPVVASTLDGTQDAVMNGQLGTLVDPTSADSLVQGISNALNRKNGVPKGLEYFAYDRFCTRFQNAINKLLDNAA